ncbi:MAG TPA: addiction module protein [Gammaproteobacteria bacterium]|nr:addiction module protein [Gammaproteobacteria bacterium]
MSKLGKEIMAAALKLPASERAVLADEILHSLDKTDPEIDALWAQEAENRLAAYDRGEIEAMDVDAVIAEVRERLKR